MSATMDKATRLGDLLERDIVLAGAIGVEQTYLDQAIRGYILWYKSLLCLEP